MKQDGKSCPKIVIDLDGTLTIDDKEVGYAEKRPNLGVIERVRYYREIGYEIVVHTARNMRTYSGNVGEINVYTLPIILEWLKKHDVPFDEVIVGKPWCGHGGFYVDDRAIRPNEFAEMNPEEIEKLLGNRAPQ